MNIIITFHDILVWQKAHKLVLMVYEITKSFPLEEKYTLIPQIRRAAISVASNIVEGFNRKSTKESKKFYNYSESSLEEVKYQLLIAKDLQYISEQNYHKINDLTNEVGKMLNGWIKSQDTY